MHSQHEDASVKMFHHLIEENKLESSLESYGISSDDRIFIGELIAGPPNSTNISPNVSSYYFIDFTIAHRCSLCKD